MDEVCSTFWSGGKYFRKIFCDVEQNKLFHTTRLGAYLVPSTSKAMPKVYVTQVPHRRDRETNSFVPAFNITPASEHGELDVMMPPSSAFYNTAELVRQLAVRLAPYDYVAGDSCLLLGDTSIVAATVAVLAKRHSKFAVLRWDRNLGRYTRVVITV